MDESKLCVKCGKQRKRHGDLCFFCWRKAGSPADMVRAKSPPPENRACVQCKVAWANRKGRLCQSCCPDKTVPPGQAVPTLPTEPRTDNEKGISSHLAAMRWVLEQDATADDTPLKRAMRDYFNDRPIRFLEEKAKLEGVRETKVEADKPTAKLIDLIDGLVEKANALAGPVS